jgi:hypothetical protein
MQAREQGFRSLTIVRNICNRFSHSRINLTFETIVVNTFPFLLVCTISNNGIEGGAQLAKHKFTAYLAVVKE